MLAMHCLPNWHLLGVRGGGEGEQPGAVQGAIERVGLADRADRPMKTLSGGLVRPTPSRSTSPRVTPHRRLPSTAYASVPAAARATAATVAARASTGCTIQVSITL